MTHTVYAYTFQENFGEQIEDEKRKCDKEVAKLKRQRDALPDYEMFGDKYNHIEQLIEDLLFACDEKVAHLAKQANGWDPDEQDRRELALMGRGG